MNSEKVKEIKKIADFCMKRGADCGCCAKGKETDAMLTCRSLMKELLTLINELESENESCHEVLADLKTIIKQQNDRIAELEEYIKGNEQDAKAFVNGWHKDLETELKQFAEMLKENITIWYPSVIESIDDTLKEFIGE